LTRQSWLPGLALGLLLTACRSLAPPPESMANARTIYEQKAAAIAAWDQWAFLGRLSLDDGQDGGSGQLHWQVRKESSQMDFRGSLGRGAWRLRILPDRAILEKADGSLNEARDVDQLIQREIGWQVPVDALAFWVRGLEAPGDSGNMKLDPSGRITSLQQLGWNIEFDRYRTVGAVELPGRIEAVQGTFRVKLVAGRWTGPETG
jgi:outer membrane lipoprotein LolB